LTFQEVMMKKITKSLQKKQVYGLAHHW
jgi:hypothetical protein